MITDVWADLQAIFATWVEGLYPGIQVRGLDRHTQEYILKFVCSHVRDVGPALDDMATGEPIDPRTVDEMIEFLLSDDIDGMVWVETEVEGLPLPQIGFFAPTENTLSIHYITGMWDPLTMIGLFELLRWINDLGEHIQIELERGTAPDSWCDQFNLTWASYLMDKG